MQIGKSIKSNWFVYLLIPLSIVMLFWGFRNEKDPFWAELDTRLSKNFVTLNKSVDSIQYLYNQFHGTKIADDSLAYKLMAKPFLPTMEFNKLKEYFTLFNDDRHHAIFSAVTGSGNTTLVDRIGNLIASKPENKMLILCAPQFDLEYNKKYIGYFQGEKFVKGELLKYWDKCLKNPNEKYVCILDNIDKINPETFFGPNLWQKLDDPKMKVILGTDTIVMPPNFYMLSITQTGVGQKIELTNEHIKRLGGMLRLPIHPNELILGFREKKNEVQKDLIKKQEQLKSEPQSETIRKDLNKLTAQLSALNDTPHLKKVVYFFIKTNEMIEKNYSYGHQIGQWSDIRKNFMPKDFDLIKDIFINHVNAYRPAKELKKDDFKDILYTINNDGSIPNSSPIWRTSSTLSDMGFASELGVAGSFALISGIFGWFYLRRRKEYIRDFTQRIYALMDDFENQRKGHDDMVAELTQIKKEFDELVLTQKINYNEAAFFYSFLNDKTHIIEIAREINGSFLKLVDVFLEDNHLSDSEYTKLIQFLESIRHRITTPQYLQYKEDIEQIHRKFGNKKMDNLPS
jgi:hypothetical protein